VGRTHPPFAAAAAIAKGALPLCVVSHPSSSAACPLPRSRHLLNARPDSFARDHDKTQALLDAGWLVVRIRTGRSRTGRCRTSASSRPITTEMTAASSDRKQIALTVETVMAELNRRLLPAAAAA